MSHNEVKIITFENINLDEIAKVGRTVIQESEKSIEYHTHNYCFEIIYHYTGEQKYKINGEEYKISGGQILIVRPGELHGSGKYISERKVYYNIVFHISPKDLSFLGMTECDTQKLKMILQGKQRIFSIRNGLKTLFDDIINFNMQDYGLHSAFYKASILILFNRIYASCIAEHNKIPNYINELATYIDKNPNEIIDFEKFAYSKSISPRKLKYLFTLHKGLSPSDYVMRARINRAEELLSNTNLSITDIAFEMGFSSSQHFATTYKKYKHRTPSQYRNACLSKNSEIQSQNLDWHILNSNMR
ncbi:MAG TPA: AraC family transcriptional regulator [Clostridiales bacterium]|nr:AraC family transcriptional regulator [Clostridiales bacterium]